MKGLIKERISRNKNKYLETNEPESIIIPKESL